MTSFAANSYFFFMALGFGVGAYGTLIGAGGGFVLMPLLLLLYPERTPAEITSISLAVIFLNALSGSEAYARMKRIDYKSAIMFAAATIPGAILGAMQTSIVPRRLFDLIFAIVLILGAVFLIFKPSWHHDSDHSAETLGGHSRRHIVDASGHIYDYYFNPLIGIAISMAVGYMSSFLGIGGGIIHVPVLVYLLNFPVHIATATSHLILVVMALVGTLVHIYAGVFSHGVHHMISLGIGVVAGAQVGALLSNRLKGGWIIRSLGGALGLVGIRILVLVLTGGQ